MWREDLIHDEFASWE